MSRVVTGMVVLSTALMLMIILGAIAWVVSDLASQSLAEGLFVGGFTIAGATLSAWIAIRLAQPIVKRNREYMDEWRRRRGS